MSMKKDVPDAWDDDWTAVADKPEAKAPVVKPAPKLTKSERKAQHIEQQRQLWDTAENPDRFHWLEAQGVVPLKQEFKPQVTLLSRKPAPMIAKKELINGIAQMNVVDDENSEDEARKKNEASLAERQRKAKLEREEKQRKYAEARERIMGSSNAASPALIAREHTNGVNARKTRAKTNSNRNSQSTTPSDVSPARATTEDKQLFDPNDMGRRLPPRSSNSTPVSKEEQPLRQPRGPESAGRGGFGFSARGGRNDSEAKD